MSWAQLTNRPTANGSQHFDHYQDHPNHYQNRNPRQPQPQQPQHRIRAVNGTGHNSPPRFNNSNNNQQSTSSRGGRGRPAHNKTYTQPKVGLTASKKRHHDINYVILDAGAFIGRRSLFNHFDVNTRYYMTPGVEEEIRDKHTRNFLENFPFHIQVKRPDPASTKFVQQFLANNPNLRSLSRADRQVIALAHTLQAEYGKPATPHENDDHVNKQQRNVRSAIKAMTVIDDVKHNDDDAESNNSKSPNTLKKSKTGRVHTVVQAQPDTGVRLSMLKKVIPFEFDDFLNLSQQEYGEKYGVPMQMATERELLRGSPALSKPKPKFNPLLKAETEARGSVEFNDPALVRAHHHHDGVLLLSDSPLSKAQRRRLRKRQSSDKHAPSNAMMTAENLQLISMQAADAVGSDEHDDQHSMDELKLLGEITEQSVDEVMSRALRHPREHDAESVHSENEIQKMMEEDINTTFQENESIITSLTAQSTAQSTAAGQVDAPSMMHSQSLPAPATATAAGGFGTLFNHQPAGSFFGAMSSDPLPPLGQNDEEVLAKQKKEKKVCSSDAWNGAWMTADNFKAEPKNAQTAGKRKLKLKDVSPADVAGGGGAVATITMDLAIQRAMTEMGLRVLSNEAHIQYGQNQNQNQNQQQEPVQHKFRCYACYTFEHDTTRTHCRVCGGDTYQRVAIYRDEHGKEHYRYSYRDRYGYRYLEKHSLVPRGSQLVKSNQSNARNVNAGTQNLKNQKKKRKKRSYLQQPGNNWR